MSKNKGKGMECVRIREKEWKERCNWKLAMKEWCKKDGHEEEKEGTERNGKEGSIKWKEERKKNRSKTKEWQKKGTRCWEK